MYAKTRVECEEKLAELIKTMKAEIAAEKKKAKQALEKGATTYFGIAEMGQPSKFWGR